MVVTFGSVLGHSGMRGAPHHDGGRNEERDSRTRPRRKEEELGAPAGFRRSRGVLHKSSDEKHLGCGHPHNVRENRVLHSGLLGKMDPYLEKGAGSENWEQ